MTSNLPLLPSESCPKCGARHSWSGPRYTPAVVDFSVGINDPEALIWRCEVCGYSVKVPCLDAPVPQGPKAAQ